MKRLLAILAAALVTASAFAQNLPAKMRMEITEIEQNDDVYSVFQYKDDDAGAASYYLSLRKVRSGFDFSIGDSFTGGIQDYDETCLSIGSNLSQAIEFMDTLLDLTDQQPGTSVEFASRPTVLLEGMGDYTTTQCNVVKTLFGKRLEFVFKGRGDRTSALDLTKTDIKALKTGIKFHQKLHPDD
ncbi:MAG: hypothetical protein K6G53_03585 [Bacteroidales bacterium]|nr:hypothetical protein [Bacteroidales bacterium]